MLNFGFSAYMEVSENIEEVIIKYFDLFELLELKIKQKNYIESLIQINKISNQYKNSLSLHLESDLLKRNKIPVKYLKSIGENINKNTKLITHFNKKLSNIEKILKNLGENGVLLIENEKNKSNEFIYFLNNLDNKNHVFNDRVKLCIDIGHLIFDLGYIQTEKNLKEIFKQHREYISEIHIHDVINNNDHCLPSTEGIKFYKRILSLLNLNSVRFIFEIKNIDIFSNEVISVCEDLCKY